MSILHRNSSKRTCRLHDTEMTYRYSSPPQTCWFPYRPSIAFALFMLGTHLSSPFHDPVKFSLKSCSVRVLAQQSHSFSRYTCQSMEEYRVATHVDMKLLLRILHEMPAIHMLLLQIALSDTTRWIMRREGQKEGEAFKKLSGSYQNY